MTVLSQRLKMSSAKGMADETQGILRVREQQAAAVRPWGSASFFPPSDAEGGVLSGGGFHPRVKVPC